MLLRLVRGGIWCDRSRNERTYQAFSDPPMTIRISQTGRGRVLFVMNHDFEKPAVEKVEIVGEIVLA